MSDATPRTRSLFQVSVVLAVIGVLATALIGALYFAQEQAERTVMEATVRNMDSGVRMEVATRIIRGQEASLRDLLGTNPVVFLESPPAGYSGICKTKRVADEWCFDEAAHEIVYRPNRDWHIEYAEPSRAELRWRIMATAETAVAKGGAAAPVGAIRVVSTTSFAWR